ncbi:RCC1/BLIP-II protein [Cutaneotrichosporon oleaginosum]|uniref:RCC1/BLIP-II protein n=1 Tax=Cutaneotrichosporon oleaginosum TaxID=879819 RepID=A0A0J1ATR4_9TREE|nr:RCC1/BLIP-II protein [Cutaneotrichosporon oleaginosum]KLT38724.1 RCC1/BLIP-II protein [Cutaneotrichosporon oleaginosum]TXT15445.1 hypothetical protein COLE_01638 [Cutaneotrichosporon oleaginosum]
MPPRSSARNASKPTSATAAKPATKKTTPKPSSKPASKPKSSAKDKDDEETKATTKPASKAKPASKPAPKAAKPASKAEPKAEPKAATKAKPKASPKVEDKPAPAPKVNGTKRGASEQPKKEVVKKRRTGTIINPIAKPEGTGLSAFVWGTGDNGQFGTGPDDLGEKPRPQLNTWFEEKRAQGEMGNESNHGGLEAIASGGMHNLGIDELGQVRSWGINDGAQLGRKTVNIPDPSDSSAVIPFEELETQPLVVEALKADGFRAVKVAAGDGVSIALSDLGDLRAWGSFRSNEGPLGFDGVPGHDKKQFKPMELPGLARVEIADVVCGSDHVLALTTDGFVYVWGNSQQGQLGRRVLARRPLNALEPERLGLRNIVLVGAGSYTSFAVDVAGKVYAWGLNTFKQCGLSGYQAKEEMIMSPTEIESLSPDAHNGARVVQISGGEHHTLFLFDDGSVWGCGRQDAHEIGVCDDHPAQEGLRERKEAIRAEKQALLDELKEKDEKVRNDSSATDEQKEEIQLELLKAEASLRVKSNEYIPEPIRICFPKSPKQYGDVPELEEYTEEVINPIVSISCGPRYNVAVSRSGWVYTWGLGLQCELGLGANTDDAETPTLCRSAQLRPYDAVTASAGGQVCVLLAKKREEDQ